MVLIKKARTRDLTKLSKEKSNGENKETTKEKLVDVKNTSTKTLYSDKLEKSSKSFELMNYIYKKDIFEVSLLPNSYTCRQMLINFNEDNVTVILKAVKSLKLKDEKAFLYALLSRLNGMTSKKIGEFYGEFDEHALEVIIPSELVSELKDIYKTAKAKERGFIVKGNNKNEIIFNANEFVHHFMKRCFIVTTKEGEIYFYNKKGYYDKLSDVQIGKIIREIMHEGIPNSWRSNYEKEVIKAIQREAPIVDEMNPFRDYINVENGMLNITDNQLHNHSPDFYSTVQISTSFDINAQVTRFRMFMDEITVGDESLIMVIQELMGYILSAETKAEKAFFFYGSGANGKSVLVSIITQLVGRENISSIPLSDFGQPFGLEGLINKTVNIAAENEMGGKALKTENFKAIVSGDTITINIKYRPAISYKPHCKLIFVVNTLPETIDVTNGFFRKLVIIPFNKTFKPEERNVNLLQELSGELSGILNWALEGLKRLKKNKYQFSKCRVIEVCHQNYYAEQNPVRIFVSEHVVQEEGVRTKRTDFYDEYVKWLNLQGIDDKGTKSRQTFWKYFKIVLGNEDISIVEKKVNGTNYFDGIAIKGIDQTFNLH